jgi:hypothetical protein
MPAASGNSLAPIFGNGNAQTRSHKTAIRFVIKPPEIKQP